MADAHVAAIVTVNVTGEGSHQVMTAQLATPGDPMLFILSFRQRDELAGAATAAGWRVVAARRAEGAERRMLASGAAVGIVDARGAIEEGIAAVVSLGNAAAANGMALMTLVSRGDVARLGELLDAGATHFMVSPVSGSELAMGLRYAQRQADRHENRAPARRETIEPLGWRYDHRTRSLQLTPGLADALGLDEAPRLAIALRALGRPDRAQARGALARLGDGAPSTAFAHDIPGLGRIVQHIQRDPHNGRLHALIEPLGNVPDAGVAVRDALTGARDAASARRWIDDRIARGESDPGSAVGVILIGVRRFEMINTAYGRSAGDALLRAVTRRIEEVARGAFGRGAVIARLGGAEFLVSGDGDAARIELAAAALREAMARPFAIEGRIVPVGAPLAIAWSRAGEDAAQLMRRGGFSLAEAAPGGAPGGTAHAADVADQSLDQLAVDLRSALDAGEVEIRFQPQVEIASGRIIGVEALARWRHPALGELGAQTLLAAAARAELSIALSDHIQRIALEAAARWPASCAHLRLSVNITAEDIARPSFADLLLDIVDASGFPRSRLTFEVTESGLMEDLGIAARLLSELRQAGCRVAIDDFGTGYSSLAYLKALPLDYLKIDRQLSQDIAGSPRDRVVVRGVIEMARSLGLAVIAEGVESEAQLDLLAAEGCQYFQGYLCAEPLDDAALVAFVEAR